MAKKATSAARRSKTKKSAKKKTAARKKARRAADRKFRILSIDGGGIRGILPGQILVTLEGILQKRARSSAKRIADFFDMIVGTSTGGILACCLLAPKSGSKRPRFSAAEAVGLYLDRGDEVFDLSLWQRTKSLGGLRDEKYDAGGLEDALEDYFGDLKLGNLLRPCLITAYDIRQRKAHFFRQHRAKTAKRSNFFVRDVARATSAAPTFFEAARVKSMTGVPYPLIDGGVFANNPALCAYAEARSLPDKWKAKDMFILSLGTGQEKKPYPYSAAKNWGKVEWIIPVLDIMMSGVSETVDFQLAKIYDAVGRPHQYLRIEPGLGNASAALDDASPENLRALRDAGQAAADAHHDQLRAFAELL